MNGGLSGAAITAGFVFMFLVLVGLVWLVVLTKRLAAVNAPEKNGASAGIVYPAGSSAISAAPAVQAGIDDETVAAISAAIYACMDSGAAGTKYVIREIKRASGARPVWGFAGMQQNTRPF